MIVADSWLVSPNFKEITLRPLILIVLRSILVIKSHCRLLALIVAENQKLLRVTSEF